MINLPRRARMPGVQAAIMISALAIAAGLVIVPLPSSKALALRAHYVGLSGLFLFLVLSELCHLKILADSRGAVDPPAIQRTALRWRLLAELMPGAAAITILGSGIRLMMESSYTLRQGWLLCLVCGFAVFFVDGLIGYTRQVQRLHLTACQEAQGEAAGRIHDFVRSGGFNVTVLSHFLAFPLVLTIGYFKPVALEGLGPPVARVLASCSCFLGGRLEGPVSSMLVILLVGAVVLACHAWREDGRGVAKSPDARLQPSHAPEREREDPRTV
jgi:uncharacterized membrane protein